MKSTKKLPLKSVPSKVYDPIKISKELDIKYNHFIIYPSTGGYRFALFYRDEKTDPFEMIGASAKAYKLKSEAVRTMKKIMYGFGDNFMKSYIAAYDPQGNEISLKVQYNIKKLL